MKKLSLLAALTATFSLTACGPMTREDRVAAMTGSVTAGQTLYMAQCASCHGTDGKGTASGVTLVDPAKTKMATALITVIINGKKGTDMAAYGAFTDQQIADLYAYIKQTFGK
ncbi:MAG: cytochrome c [Myxococcaceae bacterium]